jgi:acetoin utilization protein AcuB
MDKGMVKNWMSSPVVTATREMSLTEARRIISEKQIRALPVVENNNLVGIVTKRGLLRVDLSFLEDEAGHLNVDPANAKVGDILTVNPLTILPESVIPKAARIMLENKITALPVKEDGKLIGILTNSDLLRFILSEYPALKRKHDVSYYMTDEVVSIDRDSSLLEAHRLMGTKRIRSLVVMEGEKMVGLITRTDLMSSDPSRLASRNNQELSLKILTQSVEKVMSRDLITILPTAPVTEAAELMLKYKIHCLPVVDVEKTLVGIITESDLFLMIVQKFF